MGNDLSAQIMELNQNLVLNTLKIKIMLISHVVCHVTILLKIVNNGQVGDWTGLGN